MRRRADAWLRWAPWAIVGVGVVALLSATLATPELMTRLSPDGMLSPVFLTRLQRMRVLAALVGTVLIAASSWRLGRRRAALVALFLGAAWSVAVIAQAYPGHRLFQPRRLIKAALGEELLLKDYDPIPRLVVPVHEVRRAKYPVINIHTHFENDLFTWDRLQDLLAVMDVCNVQRLVDLNGGMDGQLEEALARYAEHPDRFSVFVHFWFGPDRLNWEHFQQRVERLDEMKRLGAKGIKIWKHLGLATRDRDERLIPLDDPGLDPLWDKAEELALPILIHVGDPPAFFTPVDEHNERFEELGLHPEWSFHGPQFPSLAEMLAQFERMIVRHPRATFILAHLGNRTDDLQATGSMLDRHPNLFMDIAARVSELGRQPRAARAFFIRYQDRLLFGTDSCPDAETYQAHFRFLETDDEYFDYPFRSLRNFGRWTISGIHLPDEVLRKFYYDNAAKILKLPPLAELERRR